MTSINIPNGVTEIEYTTFEGCSSLTSINIPDGVTKIGYSAFKGCSSLPSFDIPRYVYYLGESVFAGCSNLTRVSIPNNNISKIYSHTFEGCSSLTSINIPNRVYISDRAFKGCSDLTSINFRGSPRYLGDETFADCSNLTSFHFPIEYYGESSTFKGCSSLTSIYVNWTRIGELPYYKDFPYYIDENMYDIPRYKLNGVDTKSCTLFIPKGSYDFWAKNERVMSWSKQFKNIVEYDVTGISHITNSQEIKEISRYSVDGKLLKAPCKGVNIVKYSNGMVKKIIVQ